VNQASAGDESSLVVATHNGMYHADEAVAIALLAGNVSAAEINLIRTRDQNLIDAAHVAIDVGGVYCPEKGRFDHHFVGSPTREDGAQLASAGLIELQLAGKLGKHTKQFVRRVDASDTGVKTPGWRFSMSVSKTNPLPGSSPQDYDSRFLEIVSIIRHYVIPILEDWVNEEDAVEDVIEAATASFENHPQVTKWLQESETAKQESEIRISAAFARAACLGHYLVELSQPEVALHDMLGAAPEGMFFVTFPTMEGTHMVQQIPLEKGSFQGRLPLPEAWAGKRGEALQAVTGVPDAVFCHPGRFIAGASSHEGAVRLAALAMAKP
jgi:uncharacterized UPF0160 family protein